MFYNGCEGCPGFDELELGFNCQECGYCQRGPRGPRGNPGPQGACGRNGDEIEALFVYNFEEEHVTPGHTIKFDQPAVPYYHQKHISFINPSVIRIHKPGLYNVEYYLKTCKHEAVVALFANDCEIPGSRYSASGCSDCINGRVLFVVREHGECPVDITLRNVGSHPIYIDNDHLHHTDNASLEIMAFCRD